MKFNVNKDFWERTNWASRPILMIGFWFIDLGMKLSGLEEGNE